MRKMVVLAALLAACGAAMAEDDQPDIRAGGWGGYAYPDKTALVATSKEGISLSYGCKADGCAWMLVLSPHLCREGAPVPLLVRGDAGSIAITGACAFADDEASGIVMGPTDSITALVHESKAIEIGAPTPGAIQSITFDTSGFATAKAQLAKLKK